MAKNQGKTNPHQVTTLTGVDLTEFPSEPASLEPEAILSLGDLHGNAIKFLWILIKEGIIKLNGLSDNASLNTPEKCYQQLVAIYKKDSKDLTSDDLKCFKDILSASTVKPVQLLSLLGDELNDRGNNDIFMIFLLNMLKSKGQAFEIALSDHGCGFLAEQNESPHSSDEVVGIQNNKSLTNLKAVIEKDLVSDLEISAFYQETYLPALNLINYSIDKSITPPALTLKMHAPVGLEVVKGLAKTFKVKYDDSSIEALCATIDKVNIAFKASVKDGSFFSMMKAETTLLKSNGCTLYPNVKKFFHGSSPVDKSYPLTRLFWHRRPKTHDDAGNITFAEDSQLEAPALHNGFNLYYMHGHDGPKQNASEHMLNTDNDVGKRGLAINTPDSRLSNDLPLLVSSDTPAYFYQRTGKPSNTSLNDFKYKYRDRINDSLLRGLKDLAKELDEAIKVRYKNYPNAQERMMVMRAIVAEKMNSLTPSTLMGYYAKKETYKHGGKYYKLHRLDSNVLLHSRTTEQGDFQLGLDEVLGVDNLEELEKTYDTKNNERNGHGFQFSPMRDIKHSLEVIEEELKKYETNNKFFVAKALKEINKLLNSKQPNSTLDPKNVKDFLEDLREKLTKGEEEHYKGMFFRRAARRSNSTFAKLLPHIEKEINNLNTKLESEYLIQEELASSTQFQL